MQITTVVMAHIDVFSLRFDDFHGDQGESTLITAVDWQQW